MKVKQHSTLFFIAATFSFSWVIWLILYLSIQRILPIPWFSQHRTLTIVIGGSAPSLAAFGFAWLENGANGLLDLLRKITRWRINIVWYLFSILYMFAVFYLPALICNLFGDYFTISQRVAFGPLIPLFLGQIFAGPLNEEFGWRGYLLPKIQQKQSPFITSLIVGLIHGLWHLPLFLFYLSEPLPLYLFKVVTISIIYTWMFNRTQGSLIPILLLHTFYNFISVPITMRQIQPNSWYLILSNVFALAPVIFAAGSLIREGNPKTTVNP